MGGKRPGVRNGQGPPGGGKGRRQQAGQKCPVKKKR